jgi:hypothetical protein
VRTVSLEGICHDYGVAKTLAHGLKELLQEGDRWAAS